MIEHIWLEAVEKGKNPINIDFVSSVADSWKKEVIFI
jgi:hypothetical protein